MKKKTTTKATSEITIDQLSVGSGYNLDQRHDTAYL